MVTIAIVGSTAPGGGGLWLVHLWLVGVVIDVILTLRKNNSRQSHGHKFCVDQVVHGPVLVYWSNWYLKFNRGSLPWGGG